MSGITVRYFLVFFMGASLTGTAQVPQNASIASAKAYAEEISALVKKHALYRDSIDWPKLEEAEKSLTITDNDSTNKAAIVQLFIHALRTAGDQHSFFLTKRTVAAVKKRENTPKPEARYLGDNIGLIKIPFCFNLDNAKDKDFANTIKNEIEKIDTAYDVSGWIIDLRQNVGGNMWPMLGGLTAVLEDGIVGYFISPSSTKEIPWESRNGRMVHPVQKINSYKIRQAKASIAVLIDTLTASSGEMTAIAFKGLPNVRFFGQESAGLTTANSSYTLSDGNGFVLAVSCVADRTKTRYTGKIIPDFFIKPNNLAPDESLDKARTWLLNGAITK